MTAIRTTLENAFETALTAEMGPNDLTAQLASIGSLTSPAYLVIDMDDDLKREYILFDDTWAGTTVAAATIAKRYLPGSASGSNITHANGAVVRAAAMAQHIEDLHDRIDGFEHGTLQGLGDNDHPQYILGSSHTKAAHDSLLIDAYTLEGNRASAFAADDHGHGSTYAPASHVGSTSTTTGHPLATNSSHGFMSSGDKSDLTGLVNEGGEPNQDISSGVGIDLNPSGPTSGDVTISHADPGASDYYLDYTPPSGVLDALDIDAKGHVRSVHGKNITPGGIGAATASHTHSYTPLTTCQEASGFAKLRVGGTEVLSISGTQNYQRGIPYGQAQYEIRCSDIGNDTRQLYYYDDSSTERNKHDIEPSPLQGGETLKWDMYQFRKNLEGESGPIHQWTIAERIQEKSGDDFIVRDDEGLIQNTDDRAMMADMILTIQSLHARIEELESQRA